MDIRDIEGDRLVGLRTLAMCWSEARAARYGFLGIMASLVPLCAFVAVAGAGKGALVALLLYSASIGAAAFAWTRPGGRQLAIEIMKCSFIAAILVVVAERERQLPHERDLRPRVVAGLRRDVLLNARDAAPARRRRWRRRG